MLYLYVDARPVPSANIPVSDSASLLFADRVASLIKSKFSDLTDQLTSGNARRKVLAGIVMTSEGDENSAAQEETVICVTTGTKCINGEYLSDRGTSINDCHAEIIARRCLRRFLWLQVRRFFNSVQSIFVRNERGTALCLKRGVKFHLFISSAPCGDARLFAPHEPGTGDVDEANNGIDDRHPNRQSRGQLRTKIESGEGTIISVGESSDTGVQTWDGIVAGERLRTMSCSDKLAKMNVLGVQGSFEEIVCFIDW